MAPRTRKANEWATMLGLLTGLGAVGTYIFFKDQMDRSPASIAAGLAIMLFVFCSWIPGALLRRMWPQHRGERR